MAAKPRTFEDCLAGATAGQRAALEKLRATIRAAAPGAEEGVSYGLAAFRLNGKPLVALGAGANHCALYLMNGATVEAHADELKGYDTSKGTVRFDAARPLPASLVRKLVKSRVAEVAAKSPKVAKASPRTDPAVDALLRDLDHPLKREIEEVRRIVLGVSPEIGEAVKWNAPSFRTTEFFATVHTRATDAVRLVFHRGAKARDNTKKLTIPDPAGLLEWLATDRALVTLGKGEEIRANRAAFEALVRRWIGQL